ncbi:MAG: vanadium-dependent haloperoxidase [Saprospiraceae bacterium]|nr:vanadium-dependent haloperoxidase [Saprospiraceae bacterium]HMW38794.1 vanadium-dependent haloperoxidase [Saprospiraceae bacterium]HMX88925.1 vanadium-dependent haloperoxidase [Saprospiraceae bacterium]HMZ40330.1 vanadium-dependent haloperoxidase [Saprospiraceae bacterium]HNA65127.1 vanadium-dependent haloperoxidase [Saprospiraceae bacterium]
MLNKNLFGIEITYIVFLAIAILSVGCEEESLDTKRVKTILEWNKLILELEQNTPGYRAPVTARMLAYVGLGKYLSAQEICPPVKIENLISDVNDNQSENQINIEPGIAVSKCMNVLLKLFFTTAPENYRTRIDELYLRCNKRFQNDLTEDSYSRSLLHGSEIANIIWKYSKSDSIAHDGFLFNYDHSFKPVECVGCWQETGTRTMPALLPHWGQARTFLVDKQDVEISTPIPYDTNRTSEYYKQAQEVVFLSNNLDHEKKWISEFWSDDFPGLTVSPSARWFSIAIQAEEKSKMVFKKVLELDLLLGLALNDAAVLTWNAKYKYNVQRPESYIMKYIDPDWVSMIPSPSFPAYPSGHSVFGGVATVILENYLGTSFRMTDNTHLHRSEFLGNPRSYNSFREMATENALSRMYIGVHTRFECEEGLRLGRAIGNLYIRKKNNFSFLN